MKIFAYLKDDTRLPQNPQKLEGCGQQSPTNLGPGPEFLQRGRNLDCLLANLDPHSLNLNPMQRIQAALVPLMAHSNLKQAAEHDNFNEAREKLDLTL